MRDAAVERLAKLISDRSDSDDSGGRGFRSHRPLEIHIGLAEGWFSLFLVATVVYSTIWSVQAVGWVDHLNILTLTTALGLIGGVLASKQQRFPRIPVHVVAIGFGLLLAFWQTAGAFYGGDLAALVHGMHNWFLTVQSGGTGDDDSIFLFFIVALGFILAYTSAWLVYRTRSPWLMIVANAVVLLINLSNVDSGFVIFLIVFLMAALLLLLRFNLYESVRRWRRQGLRYADDLGWDVMQAGALISIGILLLSWLLPYGYVQAQAAQLWTANANPWVQLQNTWNRVISVSGGINPSNPGNFRETLALGGNPNLNHDLVFTVQSDDASQYLASLSYDTYNIADSTWVIGGASSTLPIKANQPFPSSVMMTHTINQKVTVVEPPGEQYPFLFGATDIISTNLPANLLISQTSGATLAWLSRNGALSAGTTYNLVSAVSSADVGTLRTVPLPKDAPRTLPPNDEPVPPNYYNPAILNIYLQLPKGLDPAIGALAMRLTAKEPTMYDKAVALESYLRNNFSYNVNVHRPSNEEGVDWLLFHSDKKAFCNYFASAMAIMARSLGIPARVVAGYTNGQPDSKHARQRLVYGTDAHAWTQIYFAGYGWINFEPSPGFQAPPRPQPNQFPITSTGGGSSAGVAGLGALPGKFRHSPELNDSGVGDLGTQSDGSQQLRQHIGMAFGSLVLLILFACVVFGIWWMRLFRRYSLSMQLYGRVCLLASWAGINLRPAQTPYEYMRELAQSTPGEAELLEQLGDIYVRDQWADPESLDHPRRSGEINELPGLWKRLQPHLFLYLLRHPYFLRWLPQRATSFLRSRIQSRRAQNLSIEDEVDDEEF
jgi:transglutaminase-like putative cysteine protease